MAVWFVDFGYYGSIWSPFGWQAPNTRKSVNCRVGTDKSVTAPPLPASRRHPRRKRVKGSLRWPASSRSQLRKAWRPLFTDFLVFGACAAIFLCAWLLHRQKTYFLCFGASYAVCAAMAAQTA
jgi:hypothetical protein